MSTKKSTQRKKQFTHDELVDRIVESNNHIQDGMEYCIMMNAFDKMVSLINDVAIPMIKMCGPSNREMYYDVPSLLDTVVQFRCNEADKPVLEKWVDEILLFGEMAYLLQKECHPINLISIVNYCAEHSLSKVMTIIIKYCDRSAFLLDEGDEEEDEDGNPYVPLTERIDSGKWDDLITRDVQWIIDHSRIAKCECSDCDE